MSRASDIAVVTATVVGLFAFVAFMGAFFPWSLLLLIAAQALFTARSKPK